MKRTHKKPLPTRHRLAPTCSSLALLAALFPPLCAQAADLTYLQGLLHSTPAGSWVKASTNSFSDAWASPAEGGVTSSSPAGVVKAWSSSAWDSVNGNLLLWGGGHATYSGNEMYVWDGATGAWGRGSLPSRIEWNTGHNLVEGNGAPQSSHTYDNNVFLHQNNLFLTFGGAAFNSGGNFAVADNNGDVQRAGPWVWDPNKADPNKVGGGDGTGYGTNSQGGHMWTNLMPMTTGAPPNNFVHGTTAYRQEGGRDVIYLTAEAGPWASGWPSLWRFSAGDLRNGDTASWERVGESFDVPGFLGSAAIDSTLGLYVRTTGMGGAQDLAVWDLGLANADNPSANRNVGVQLVYRDGSAFAMTVGYGIDYDAANENLVLWDNAEGGKVYVVTPMRNPDGSVASVWTVDAVTPLGTEKPDALVTTDTDVQDASSVLGKWQYVPELGAFIALTGIPEGSTDAEVWLFKPSVAAVPEPASLALMALGVGILGAVRFGRRSR